LKSSHTLGVHLTVVPPSYCPHYDFLKTNKEDDKMLSSKIEKYGIEVLAINVFPGYYNWDDENRVTKTIERAIDLAHTLGSKVVTIPSGRKVAMDMWEGAVIQIKKGMLPVSKYAEDKQVELSVEAPHGGTITETLEQAKRFFDMMHNDAIKCTLDTSHVKRLGSLQPIDAAKYIGVEKINHVHLRDAIGEDIEINPCSMKLSTCE